MQTNRKAGKKLLAILLTLAMVLGMFSMQVAAVDKGEAVGTVTVIVENNIVSTTDKADEKYWDADAQRWDGELFTQEVTLYENYSAGDCVIDALNIQNANTNISNSAGYIMSIAGLNAGDYMKGDYSGWVSTVDDWYTSLALSNIKRADGDSQIGMLRDGSVIRMMYSRNVGADCGCDYSDDTKALSGLAVSDAKLVSVGGHEYNIVIFDEDGADITVTPTAANKTFATAVYHSKVSQATANTLASDSWYKDSYGLNLILRGNEFNVKPGDTVTVVVGAKTWASSSNGRWGAYAENVDPEVYTLNVVLGQKSGGGSGTTNYYVVHTYTDGNGTVEPEGNVMVRSGSDKTFTITPNAGYEVADVVVNGKSVGAVTSYTFKNVDHDGNIDVTFAKTTGSAAVKNPNTGAAL